jgi:hypothetical protein
MSRERAALGGFGSKPFDNKENIHMRNRIQSALTLTGFVLALAVAPAIAQSDAKMKMADNDKKMAMDSMSKEEKAALFDKMSDEDKSMATKMAGHDMSKMSATDRMAATDKMSMDDKAMMYDKMVAGKHLDKNDMKAMDAAAKMKMDEKMKMDKMKH